MITTIGHNRVTVTPNGAIVLPEHVRQTAGLAPGDELLLLWLPPDTLIMRKWSEIIADDKLFALTMREFDQALTLAGYETDDDVLRLIQEIKREQITEWTGG